MKYRPDIDGLRALAVLSVIFFHFGFTALGGGYVGVDIFFVISGFLITSIIKKDLDAGDFSFVNFYFRRIKRILPALYVTVTATYAVALIFLFPKEFAEFAQSAAAAVLNAANILFWKKAGYFDLGNEFKPLLHTWSLAVEEQFYLLFPLMMFVMYRVWKKGVFFLTAFCAILSFALSVYVQQKAPSANFYLIPTRAWELAIGSLVALAPVGFRCNPLIKSFGAWTGLALIVIPLFYYTEATVFPGLTALPVCVGAALLIMTGFRSENEPALLYHRLIATPFPVFIGKISYSLYLWHWPIYIFLNLIWGMNPYSVAAMFALTFLFGYLSYRFVETPFRHSRLSTKSLLLILGAWSVLLIALGAIGLKFQGFPGRFPAETKNYFSGQFNYDPDLANCSESPSAVSDPKACVIGDTKSDEAPKILLWGDSHGRSFTRAMKVAADEANMRFYARNMGGCLPNNGELWAGREICRYYARAVSDFIKKQKIEHVVLISRWSLYRNGSEGKNHVKMYNAQGAIHGETLKSAFDESFEAVIQDLKREGVKITIVHQLPSFDVHIPEFTARKYLWWDLKRTDQEKALTDQARYSGYNLEFERKFSSYLQENGVREINPGEIFCPGPGKCLTEKDGYALYRDTNHLSVYGAETLAPLFRGVFSNE